MILQWQVVLQECQEMQLTKAIQVPRKKMMFSFTVHLELLENLPVVQAVVAVEDFW